MPDNARSIEILNVRRGNTVAAFEDSNEAHEALGSMASQDPQTATFLALVYFDADGDAIEWSRSSRGYQPRPSSTG